MATYIALLRKEAKTDFGVDFPDFPGCVTAGSTLEEAHRRAAEALALHVEGMVEDGEEIPAPTPLDVLVKRGDTKGAVPFLVSIPDPQPRAVRVNVTFSPEVLDTIDAAAEREQVSRSAFLAKAAMARAGAAARKSKRAGGSRGRRS